MGRVLPWLMALALSATPVFAANKNDKKDDKKDERKAVRDERREDRRVAEKRETAKELKYAPSEKQVERALSTTRWMQDRTIRKDFKDGRVFFTPADLGGLSDEQLAGGFILGYIETDRKCPSGIDGGGNLKRFPVFVEKSGNDWNVFFTHAGQALAKSEQVEGGLDNVHPPVWQRNGDAIWYGRIRFGY